MPHQHTYDLLINVYLLLEDGTQQVLQRFGLTSTQYNVLLLLDPLEGRRPVDLAARLLVDKSRLTRVTDKLEHAGLVHRRADPTDRRALRVVLTEEGVRRRAAAHSAHERSIEQRLSSLHDDDRCYLNDVLERLRTHLRTDLAGDG